MHCLVLRTSVPSCTIKYVRITTQHFTLYLPLCPTVSFSLTCTLPIPPKGAPAVDRWGSQK